VTRGRRTRILLVSAALLLLLLVVIATFAARRPVDTLNWLTPSSSYRLESDIAYGDLVRQRLDVYRPVEPRATPAPVVVFFYGGSWSNGDRGDYRFVGQMLAQAGFVTVIPDYRIYPEAKFPTFLQDGAKALRWTQDHIAALGGDPQRLFLMGHSAGAYNAMMLALDRRYGAEAGVDAARIRGVVGLAGPYDFKLDRPLLRSIFGAAPDFRETQPVNFAAAGAPPVLLVMGDADDTVRPENSRSLARHLAAVGSPVTLREVPGLDHMDVVLQLSWIWSRHSAIRDEITRFLDDPGAITP
jgi:acetyl esterase/lipase